MNKSNINSLQKATMWLQYSYALYRQSIQYVRPIWHGLCIYNSQKRKFAHEKKTFETKKLNFKTFFEREEKK